eukprot:gene7767-10552_t
MSVVEYLESKRLTHEVAVEQSVQYPLPSVTKNYNSIPKQLQKILAIDTSVPIELLSRETNKQITESNGGSKKRKISLELNATNYTTMDKAKISQVNKKSKLSNNKIHCKEIFPADIGSKKVKQGKITQDNMNQSIQSIIDSTKLYHEGKIEELWRNFRQHGYIYVKGLVDRDIVLDTKELINDTLHNMNYVKKDKNNDDVKYTAISPHGWTVDTDTGCAIKGKDDYTDAIDEKQEIRLWKSLCSSNEFKYLAQHENVKKLIIMLRDGKQSNEGKLPMIPHSFYPNFSWLRIKAPHEFTPEHADEYFFKLLQSLKTNSTHSVMSNNCCYERQTQLFSENGFPLQSCRIKSNCEWHDCPKCSKKSNDILLKCTECLKTCHIKCIEIYKNNIDNAPKDEWFCSDCSLRPILGTCWLPLGDISVNEGVLALLPQSDKMPNFNRSFNQAQFPLSYFKYCKDFTWHTGPFEAGDAVLFNSRLMHCSSMNYTRSFRYSLDFRWILLPDRKNSNQKETCITSFVNEKGRKL